MLAREAEERSAVESAQVGTFRWDAAGARVECSAQLERLWGCGPAGLDGSYAAFVQPIHPDDRDELEAQLLRCLATRTALRADFRVVWPDGSVHWIWVSGAPTSTESGAPAELRGAVMEVSAGKHAALMVTAAVTEREHELERLTRLYAALSRVNQAIVTTTARPALLVRICEALCAHGGFLMSWIGMYDPATQRIAPVASAGDETGYLHSIAIYADDRPEGQGPTGTAFREQRTRVSNDLLQDPAFAPWRAALPSRAVRASAVIPIREAGQVCGTLSVYAGEPGFFRDKEVALLEEAARDVSFALDNLARDAARKQAEATLREERDFSDAVIRSLPGVLYLYDQRGRFLRWNENFERVSGYTAAQIAAMQPLQFFAATEQATVADRIATVFERGHADLDADFLAKDGTTTPYHFTGVRTELDGRQCLIGVGIDISERVAADRRYRTLFASAPDAIIIVDPRNVYLDANPSACRMLGYAREELVGLHASALVAPVAVPQIAAALRDVLATTDHHREWQLRRKDGSIFPADVIATLMPDGNLLALIRDDTARRQAERALRELNDSLETKVAERTGELHAAMTRAEAADRLKSAFLATMSHELRTPLNSIIGFTGIVLAQMAGPLTPEQHKQLTMVRGSARHLLELINDVLDISKIEADQLEIHAARFELRPALERVLAMVAPFAAAKGLAMVHAIAPEVGAIVSDRRRVEQIMLNLVNNAIKFTDRGSVTVCAEVTGAAVHLRVTDTGIGIADADLASLFQPFRQIDTGLTRRHEGTGLGLAICRRLAALLGGDLAVTSTPGRGSEFSLTLPLVGRSLP